MAKPDAEEISRLGRYFAISTNNEFWQLSEKELTSGEKKEVLTSAYTSLYHWQQVGTEDNKYLAFMAVARALTINHIADLAVDYAQQAFDFFRQSDEKWITAFTHAILSHALLIHGDSDKAALLYQQAKNIGNELQPEDKEIFDATFKLIPAPG